MTKFNVKYRTNTNTMTDILTTKCVRVDTATSRFCRFLSDYDSSFKESLLIASMNIRPVGYVDGVIAYQSVTETDDYYLTFSGCNNIWSVTIEFKHDDNTKHYRTIKHPDFLKSEQTESDTKDTESGTNFTADGALNRGVIMNNVNYKQCVISDVYYGCRFLSFTVETKGFKCYTTGIKRICEILENIFEEHTSDILLTEFYRAEKNSFYDSNTIIRVGHSYFGGVACEYVADFYYSEQEHIKDDIYGKAMVAVFSVNLRSNTVLSDVLFSDSLLSYLLADETTDTKGTESDTTDNETETAEQTTTETAEQTTETSESNNTYIVRAYKNCKELTVPCSFFNKREYAIDYIQALSKNGVVDNDVVFTINNQDIYNCFNDVKLIGTTAQIKYATDILNRYYKRLCDEIALEQKIRVDDVDCKDYYANLNAYVAILKKVLTGNSASDIIKNKDKFEIWGHIYGTATNFIISYEVNCSNRVIKHLESKLRKELFGDIKILF